MSEKKYGCLIFEDQFERLDKVFSDAALGRVIRTALRTAYYGEINELEDGMEWYACDELITSFERNKNILVQSSLDGQVGNAMRYAKNLSNFKDRLEGIDGLTNHEKAQWIAKYKESNPNKC